VQSLCWPKEVFGRRSVSSIARAVLQQRKLESYIKCGSVADIIDTLLLRGTYSDEE
jgi:hypothetical protein